MSELDGTRDTRERRPTTVVERLAAYVGVSVDTAGCDRCRGPSTVIRECRRCGASVGRHVEACPHCPSEGIARYEL